MFYYNLKDKVLISLSKYNDLNNISEEEAKKNIDCLYFIHKMDPYKSRRSFSISHPSLLFFEEEGVHLLQKKEDIPFPVPNWILEKINQGKLMGVNTNFPNWIEVLDKKLPEKWRINIIGLGDVGGTCLTGLRLLGEGSISTIGIYGTNQDALKRWEYEGNQILSPFEDTVYPGIHILKEKEIFDCDMMIFAASKGVPSVKEKVKDVRMIQFEENSKIISIYAKKARENKFKGIFAVLSDPVDLLCKAAFISSNQDDIGNFDFKGLAPEQIRGYGLGVMNARAAYYASKSTKTLHYLKEGRAFGPHGEDLIIADSIDNYNEELSLYLTEKAINANIDVRNTGFKPYIAPALSSGALSILSTIKGKWHYSSTYMGGVFMGANNRLTSCGGEIEVLDLPKSLMNRITSTYEKLSIIL